MADAAQEKADKTSAALDKAADAKNTDAKAVKDAQAANDKAQAALDKADQAVKDAQAQADRTKDERMRSRRTCATRCRPPRTPQRAADEAAKAQAEGAAGWSTPTVVEQRARRHRIDDSVPVNWNTRTSASKDTRTASTTCSRPRHDRRTSCVPTMVWNR